MYSVQFCCSIMSNSVTPWITAHQASLSITNSWSSIKLMSIKSVMPSRHLILCRPLLLLPPIPPSIRVFSNESTLRMRWPKYWSSASASVLPMNTQDWSPLGWTGWISLQHVYIFIKFKFLDIGPLRNRSIQLCAVYLQDRNIYISQANSVMENFPPLSWHTFYTFGH